MLRRQLLAIAALATSGCSILPERPALRYYGFTLKLPEQGNPKKLLGSLMVNQPQVAEPYNGTKFFILEKEGRFYSTEVNRFVSPPADLIGAAVRQWVAQAGPFKSVLPPNSIANPDYQMIVYVSKLYADTAQSPSQTVINMQVSVIKTSNDRVIFSKNYNVTTPMEQPSIPSMMESYTKGVEKILSDLCFNLDHLLQK